MGIPNLTNGAVGFSEDVRGEADLEFEQNSEAELASAPLMSRLRWVAMWRKMNTQRLQSLCANVLNDISLRWVTRKYPTYMS